MYSKLMSVIVLLSLIVLVSGVNVKQNDCVNIVNTCGNCTYMNITSIIFPNQTISVGEQVMTKSGTEYNYTYCFTTLGEHTVNGIGNPLGVIDIWQTKYLVTTTGFKVDSQQIVTISFILGLMLIIGLLFFYFGMRSEYPAIKIFCLSMSIIMIIFLVGYVLGIANITIGEFKGITDGFTPLYVLFIALLSVGAIGIILYLVIFAMDLFYKKRGLKL